MFPFNYPLRTVRTVLLVNCLCLNTRDGELLHGPNHRSSVMQSRRWRVRGVHLYFAFILLLCSSAITFSCGLKERLGVAGCHKSDLLGWIHLIWSLSAPSPVLNDEERPTVYLQLPTWSIVRPMSQLFSGNEIFCSTSLTLSRNPNIRSSIHSIFPIN